MSLTERRHSDPTKSDGPAQTTKDWQELGSVGTRAAGAAPRAIGSKSVRERKTPNSGNSAVSTEMMINIDGYDPVIPTDFSPTSATFVDRHSVGEHGLNATSCEKLPPSSPMRGHNASNSTTLLDASYRGPIGSSTIDKNLARNHAIDELIASTGVLLTHPDKILFADAGVTKLELARYYVSASTWMLPYIEHRPAVLVRCHDGLKKECFFQKRPMPGTPQFLQQISVKDRHSTSQYLVINDLAGLVWLAECGCLELRVWDSRTDDLERPDRLNFELDADGEVHWENVVDSARQIRDVLRSVGLESFVRTTGGYGLHVVVPIQRRSSWEEVKSFCQAVAGSMETAAPERYTSKMSNAARKGKIFVDSLRNHRGATSIACYSPRSRPGVPIATPIHWDELNYDLHSDRFRFRNIQDRFAKLFQDPWKELFTIRQSITATAKKSFGI